MWALLVPSERLFYSMEHLPGFRDFYPDPIPDPGAWSMGVREFIFARWRDTARRYGFHEYDGPPLEPLELYTAKSGAEIVTQLYHFLDKGDRAVALRPEMTPTLARLVAAHERAYKKPLKWFSIPQLFRYERQQKGRLREHFQFNADLIGEADPAADAELIAFCIDTLRGFGLTADDFVMRLSSRKAWQEFLLERGADEARAYEFYQVIDKLEKEEAPRNDTRLKALGFTLAEVKDFIEEGRPAPDLSSIIQNLSARGLGDFVKVDYNVIRGLAYYTGVVFEAFDRKGRFRAIAGGGRYDNLVKLVSNGKVHLPALGFGMGDVVLTELLRERQLLPTFPPTLDVFCLIEDDTLREDSLRLVHSLRETGRSVEYSLTPAKADKQFKRAMDLEAANVITLTKPKEGKIMARVRHARTREERIVDPAGCVQALGDLGSPRSGRDSQ